MNFAILVSVASTAIDMSIFDSDRGKILTGKAGVIGVVVIVVYCFSMIRIAAIRNCGYVGRE